VSGSRPESEASAVRWRSPGRVNLIGEHTDYNDGFALPFAIDHACEAEVSLTGRDGYEARSAQESQPVVTAVRDLDASALPAWGRYVLGPVWVLRQRGLDVPPVAIGIDSSVPVGAGLSSSAAVVCSVTAALDDLLGLGLGADELLAVTRAVENDFVGAPTGGLDQLASLRCTADHVLFCDMRDLTTDQVPFAPDDHGLTVLVVDTRAEHSHADGQYAARRTGCHEAARILGVGSLRDLTSSDLPDAEKALPDEELRAYTRHVVTENARVLGTVELLQAGKVADIGPLLSQSHASLRDDYRVTIPELDVACSVLEEHGALGARMTGGGFGGCVIALVEQELVDPVGAAVDRAYADRGFRPPRAFTVRPSRGAHAL